ncbi:RDD family protein [Glaciibacter superstes]|uniref:RDD family protein n=1 Tax=Glaciibacter superstes TaxID=501023 RepID=UPI0003B4C74A|nr:RDD family protein [Glaciibacter superstes]
MSVSIDARTDEPIPGLLAGGLPDPAYAAALGLVPAPAGRRSFAFVIDAAILVLLGVPTMLAVLPILANFDPDDPAGALSGAAVGLSLILLLVGQGLTTIYLIVQLILHGRKGITIGKAMLGIRSVNAATFARPGFWRIVLRALVFYFAFLVFPPLLIGVFLASSLWDGEKRGRSWLDKVGKNWMIDVRSGLDPFDAKALRLSRKRLSAPDTVELRRLPSLATGAGLAEPAFVPAARSSSGVISAPSHDGQEPWQPPPVGAEQITPAGAGSSQGPRPVSATPARAVEYAAVLVFDDDSRVNVAGRGLLGRNPEPQPGEEAHRLLPVSDDSWQISKTHAEFGIDARGFWISDRASSNGTIVRTPDGRTRELAAREPAYLEWGAIVEIGGRTFTIAAGGTQTKDGA